MFNVSIDPELAKAFGEGVATGVASTIGVVAIIVLLLIGLWVKYPNNVREIVAQIWKLLIIVFGVFAEKKYIKYDLEGKLSRGIDSISSRIDNLEADAFRVSFVTNADRDSFVKNRTLVMRIRRAENHGENLANVAYTYSEHLYSRVQASLNTLQRKAVSLYTAKSILLSTGGEGMQHLNTNYFLPAVTKHHNLQPLIDQLEAIDRKGFFYSVFLQEMIFLGEKVSYRPHIRGMHEEVETFLQFLVNFASRERGDQTTEKNFIGQNIKVSFILVARPENREAGLTDVYIRYVQGLPRAIESYYFMGWGENVDFVREVAQVTVESLNFLILKREKTYERCFEDGICIDAVSVLARNRTITPLAGGN